MSWNLWLSQPKKIFYFVFQRISWCRRLWPIVVAEISTDFPNTQWQFVLVAHVRVRPEPSRFQVVIIQDRQFGIQLGRWQVPFQSSNIGGVRASFSIQNKSKSCCGTRRVIFFNCSVRNIMYFLKMIRAIFSYRTWLQTTSVFAVVNMHKQCLKKDTHPYTSRTFLRNVKKKVILPTWLGWFVRG